MAVVATLLTGVVAFFALAHSSRVKNQSISEVHQQGASAVEYIAQTIRNASAITSPVPGSSSGTLTLAVPDAGLSPTVFSSNAGILQVTEGAATAEMLTGGKVQVDDVAFTNLSQASIPGVIRIELTLSRINSAGRNEYDYQQTFITSGSLR